MRSLFAGFGVAWGIFILILLLGAGTGFQQGILQLFSSFSQNSLWVFGGQVSINKQGRASYNRPVVFDEVDLSVVRERYKEIQCVSPEISYTGHLSVRYRQQTFTPQLKGVVADYFKIKVIKPDEGRLLNELDNTERRRVVLIGRQAADVLFPHESPVGKCIEMNGVNFTVVGAIEKGTLFTQNEQYAAYVPYQTFKECFGQRGEFNAFLLSLKKKVKPENFEEELKSFLSRRKGFNETDKKALFVLNFTTQTKMFDKLFNGVRAFLWFIGLCLLLSGMAGVSNIMFMIVQERTFEIGIRKAVGATTTAIIHMILIESVVLTTSAGMIGLAFGTICLQLLNWVLHTYFDKEGWALFTKAQTGFSVVLFSLSLLIVSGILAGFFPAKRASGISPVEAMRQAVA